MNEEIAFYFFGAISLVGAVNVLFRRNPVHAAMFLVASFLGVAGLFLTLGSGLLAAVQVLVYAGAIMVLFLFVILLLNLEVEPRENLSIARSASGLAGLATLALILQPFLAASGTAAAKASETGLERSGPELPATATNIGQLLFTKYMVPFEIVSLMLLIAMVGAIHLAKRPSRMERV